MNIPVITLAKAREYIYTNIEHATFVDAAFIVWVGECDLIDVYLFLDYLKGMVIL